MPYKQHGIYQEDNDALYNHSEYPLICEDCGCAFGSHNGINCPYGVSIVKTKPVVLPTPAKTQKLNGLVWLYNNWKQTRFADVTYVSATSGSALCNATLKAWNSASSLIRSYSYPRFARPCPLRPRHGFVESRSINSKTDLRNVIEKTLAEDEHAEMIIVPVMKSRYSAVINEQRISYGRSTDGATSGKDCVSLSIPLIYDAFNKAVPKDIISNSMYIEALIGVDYKKTTTLVQLRDGPTLPTTLDYVNKDTEVTRVVEAEGSLIEWEATVAKFKNEPGLVVSHLGGSLSSHYAVHCIINEIPVLCTRVPIVGETLKAATGAKEASDINYNRLAQWLHKALNDMPAFKRDYATAIADREVARQDLALLSIGCMHAQVLWESSEAELKLRAYGLASALACMYAACIGEARHGLNMPGFAEIWEGTPIQRNFRAKKFSTRAAARHILFDTAFEMDVNELASLYSRIRDTFNNLDWEGSIGGPLWLNCTQATHALYSAAVKFIYAPSKESWVIVSNLWNRMINLAHNGGVSPLCKMGDNVIHCMQNPWGAFFNTIVPYLLFDHDATYSNRRTKKAYLTAAASQLTVIARYEKEFPVDFDLFYNENSRYHLYVYKELGSVYGTQYLGTFAMLYSDNGVLYTEALQEVLRRNIFATGTIEQITNGKGTLRINVDENGIVEASVTITVFGTKHTYPLQLFGELANFIVSLTSDGVRAVQEYVLSKANSASDGIFRYRQVYFNQDMLLAARHRLCREKLDNSTMKGVFTNVQ